MNLENFVFHGERKTWIGRVPGCGTDSIIAAMRIRAQTFYEPTVQVEMERIHGFHKSVNHGSDFSDISHLIGPLIIRHVAACLFLASARHKIPQNLRAIGCPSRSSGR